jgi:hypothetical protein
MKSNDRLTEGSYRAVTFYSKDMIDGRYPGSPLDDWKDVLQDNHAFGYEEGDLFLASFPHLSQAGYGPKVSWSYALRCMLSC